MEPPFHSESQPSSWMPIDWTEGTLSFLKKINLPLYPILLFLVHGLVYAMTFPHLDLPVADDANYFGNGKLFALHGTSLYADWTPLLTYVSAWIEWTIPFGWYVKYALFVFLCKTALVLGIYSFIRVMTHDARWAFLSTLLAGICFSYWLQQNGRAFANGVFLCLLAWMFKQKSWPLITSMAVIALSYLLRPEYILVSGGFCFYTHVTNFLHKERTSLWQVPRSSWVLVFLSVFCWLPVLVWGQFNSHRLEFAFAQCFQTFAEENPVIQESGVGTSAHWDDVVDDFFPPPKRDSSSWMSRWVPLYEIASAHPRLFASFVWYNMRPFLTAEFLITQNPWLSRLIHVYIWINLFLLLYHVIMPSERNQWLPYLVYTLIFLLSLVPCLVTRPFRDYILPLVLWLFCILPFLTWKFRRYRYLFLGTLTGVILLIQIPYWVTVLEQNSLMKNWKRAMFLQDMSQKISLQNAVLSEANPIFCTAFNDQLKQSVYFDTYWDNAGFLRAHWKKDPPIDYVLLESTPPRQWRNQQKRLQKRMEHWGECIGEQGEYSLWKVKRRILAPLNRVIMTDDVHSEADLTGTTDYDAEEDREIAIHWNPGDELFQDFHIYVAIDQGEYVYLGRAGTSQARLFRWRSGEPLLEPAFENGPAFEHSYQFQVFGISPKEGKHKPVRFMASGAIQYESTPSI